MQICLWSEGQKINTKKNYINKKSKELWEIDNICPLDITQKYLNNINCKIIIATE